MPQMHTRYFATCKQNRSAGLSTPSLPIPGNVTLSIRLDARFKFARIKSSVTAVKPKSLRACRGEREKERERERGNECRTLAKLVAERSYEMRKFLSFQCLRGNSTRLD